SGTNSSDIVCEDSQYHTTGKGIKFKNCVSCLQDSQATKGVETDTASFLYNIRYAVDTCLFNFPDINSPCIISSACKPLKTTLASGLDTPNAATSYDFCTADGDKFSSSWWPCVKCLQSSDSQSYLSNCKCHANTPFRRSTLTGTQVLIALKAGCEQKPANGSLVGLTGELFSSNAVNITAPATNTTLPGDGGASATTMTTGTIVGIAVGGGLVFIGAICLFVIHCRRQRKQRAQQEPSFHDSHPPRSRSGSVATMTNGPYVPIGDHKKSSSINSYNYELQEKQTFSNNADYYDKMESDIQAGREMAHYNFDPRSNNHALDNALPTHPAYIPRAMSRQSTRQTETHPPSSRRTNTPDSYALQTYLNAVNEEGLTAIRPPPAAAVSRTPSPAHSHDSRRSAQTTRLNPPPPPPGPPPARKASSRIPSLVLPSVPRIRVPKKYSPPQITVQDATPVADKGETSDMQISQPLTTHEDRFQDRPLAGRTVISHVAPEREDPETYEGDMPIRSGKSTLYG
ncbi:hypothetical protein K4K54_003654, partial [Colletotrichum sp. SAR 10_86]